MKAPLVAFVLASLAFAGCTATDGEDDATGAPPLDGGLGFLDVLPDEPILDFEAGVPVPLWTVGDWWQYKVEYLGALPKTYDAKILVYAEDSEAWYLTSDDRELILRAGFNHYPTLGKVKKADLGEFIHAQDVSFFAWPMKNGTRTGAFRDFDAAWSVSFAELDTGKGTAPGFNTVMRRASDDAVILRHGYSPATKWFTNLSFAFRGGDAVDVQITLQDWGSNFTGEVPVVDFVDKIHRPFPVLDATAPAAPTAQAHEQVTIASERILYGAFWGGAQGEYQFCLDGGGQLSACIGGGPSDGAPMFEWYEAPVASGTTISVAGSAATRGPGFLFGELYELHESTVPVPPA